MMRLNSLIAILLVTISVVACVGSQPIASPAPQVDPGLNLLIVAEGEVQLKRNEWRDFHATSFGAVLYRGDQLRLSEGARALVLCDNLTPWLVPSGAPSGLSNGCPQSAELALVSSGGLIGNTRGGTDPLIPYIISPRATKILSSTPTLRWNPAPGATSYTVHLSGIDWQATVSATEVAYPGNPPLQPGVTYLLIVEADNGRLSKDEGVPGLGFSLLSNEEAVQTQAYATTIAALNLSHEAQAFALAQLYAGHGLYAEAIEMLEELTDAGNQIANIYRAPGDLYRQIGLPLLAEGYYLEAVMLAETAGDAEALAAAQAGLGNVYAALGNKDEAIRWLIQAQAGYQALGDSQRMSDIAKQLAELTP